MTELDINGARVLKGYLDAPAQAEMRDQVEDVLKKAPLFQLVTPWGKPMSVAMSACGRYGWITDRRGYRYERRHPDGEAWPPIPAAILRVWDALVSEARQPDSCLINHYKSGARMGMHQDRDEADFSWPVLSISLGDTATFRVGGLDRKDASASVRLDSGDVVLLSENSRLAYHGIDRIFAGSSRLLARGGRINLTLRVVD